MSKILATRNQKWIATVLISALTLYALCMLDAVTKRMSTACADCGNVSFQTWFVVIYVTVLIIVPGLLLVNLWAEKK